MWIIYFKNLKNFYFIGVIWEAAWGYHDTNNKKSNYEQLYWYILYHAINQFIVHNSMNFGIFREQWNYQQNKL